MPNAKCDKCGRTATQGGAIKSVKVARSDSGQRVSLCAICRGDKRDKIVKARKEAQGQEGSEL